MLSLRKQVKMHWKKDRQGNHVAVPLTYFDKNGTSKQPKSKKNPMISNILFMLVCRLEIRKVLEKTLPHDLISSHIILFTNSPCPEMIIKTRSPIFRHRFFNQATSPLRGLRVSFHNRCSAALTAPCCAGLSQDSRRIFHDPCIVVLKQTAAKKSCWTHLQRKRSEVTLLLLAFLLTIMYI